MFDSIKKTLGFGGDQVDVESWIADKFNSLKSAFLVYHLKIWESFLFYAGETWITLDENSKIYRTEVPQDDWVPTPRINRFSPTVDSISSNFIVPEVEAVPSRPGDPKGQNIANIATKLCSHAMKHCALRSDFKSDEDKVGMAEKCFVLAGTVFTEVKGKEIVLGERPAMESVQGVGVQCVACDTYTSGPDPSQLAPDGACPKCGSSELRYSRVPVTVPKMDEDGNPVTEPITDYEIKVSVGVPLFALPRPGSTSMSDSPYFIWAERMTIDQIWEEFGDKFPEGSKPEPDSVYLDGFSTTYQNSLNYFYAGYSSNTTQEKDSCMVVRAYVMPGKMRDFPNGLRAVYLNGHLLFQEEWQFPDHPFTKIDYLQIPTLFFARSVSFDLVPIQRELQSYESIIKLHGMTSAVEPIIIDANTMMTQPTGRADKIIKWRSIGPGSKEPHRMKHGVLDDGIYRQRDALHAEFENISGAVAVWKGRQEGAITAASAIQQLRSQAELMFNKPTLNWNNGWKETVRKIVKLMQANWPLQKFIDILGPELLTDIQMFMKSDLDRDVEFIASTHGLPRTRDEQRQEMMELFDRGVLDLRDVNVRRKAFELFGETGLLKSFNLDATRARMENEIIKNGGVPKFMPGIEDSDVHIQIHKEQAKSLDFDRWPAPSQQAMLIHIAETQKFLDDLMSRQQGLEDGEGNDSSDPKKEKAKSGVVRKDGRTPAPIPKAPEAPRV